MVTRNGWLFPLMVVAAGSVTVFGCIGIAAITGYLPLARGGMSPLGDYPMVPGLIIEQALVPQAQDAPTKPVAVVAVDGSPGTTKAIELHVDKPVGMRKRMSERTVN
jgi:hypothetical protein